MNLTNITAINLNARKNGQRTVLIEMWAEKTSTGYQKTFTEDEVETKRSYLKSQVGEIVALHCILDEVVRSVRCFQIDNAF